MDRACTYSCNPFNVAKNDVSYGKCIPAYRQNGYAPSLPLSLSHSLLKRDLETSKALRYVVDPFEFALQRQQGIWKLCEHYTYFVIVAPNNRGRWLRSVFDQARQVYRAVLVDEQIRASGDLCDRLCNQNELLVFIELVDNLDRNV